MIIYYHIIHNRKYQKYPEPIINKVQIPELINMFRYNRNN